MQQKQIKHVVKFSGGAASAVVAKIVADRHRDDTTLLFHNTYSEPADNDRFRQQVADYVGLPITDVSDGRTIWQLFEDEGMLGNQRMTPCSAMLKQEIGDKWLKANLPCVVYFGFTAEEHLRAQRAAVKMSKIGAVARFPLIEQHIGKDECLRRVRDCWGIQLPEMYEWAEHANCVPCVKGGLAYWGQVYLHAPDAWEKAAGVEDRTGEQILKETRYGTLREELPHCLNLAKEWRDKKAFNGRQDSLFETPCECAV